MPIQQDRHIGQGVLERHGMLSLPQYQAMAVEGKRTMKINHVLASQKQSGQYKQATK